jgi:hypothetical protein
MTFSFDQLLIAPEDALSKQLVIKKPTGHLNRCSYLVFA